MVKFLTAQEAVKLIDDGSRVAIMGAGSVVVPEMIYALEARDLGLVNSVVEADILLKEAKTLARKIANKAPQALKCAKWAVHKSGEVSLQVGLDYEVLYSNLLFATKDNREGTRAFLEKRRPHFKGQ